MLQRELPKRDELVEFKDAVAGHAGTLCDPEGILFIKPCTQSEIDFYEAARANHPEFADLMPLFMGTLALNDATNVRDITEQLPAVADAIPAEVKEALAELGHPHAASLGLQGAVSVAAMPALMPALVPAAAAPAALVADNEVWIPRGSQSIVTNHAIVLENATYGYKKPNVLDVKLGQRLWADDAPRQKRIRMDEVRAQTTHDKLGFRIAGMRVYRGSDAAAELDDTGYKFYDKDFGRYQVNNDNVVDAFRRFIFNATAGVDEDHGRAVALAFKTDLERVRDVLEKERTRMYSASLLFVFEGDGEALREAVKEASASASASTRTGTSTTASEANARDANTVTVTNSNGNGHETPGTFAAIPTTTPTAARSARSRREPLSKVGIDRSSSRTDSGIALDEEFEMGPQPHIVYDDIDEVDDDDDDDDELDLPHIYGLRLIDFAHAKFVPEEEQPDENTLVGVRSLIRIFDELSK
ncbi:arginine metabolism regulation protein 3 [Niveomyces insectorum RCEF 264]|uniref:Kinase n=1 Tax=Niveomyces insectorum RCEF 264 TaxID=1081102 RepID=A0A167YW52_9HYPO|nr:arginine metabolism regulation protein 3 [Niveomyces insectorum RCEF 264]